MLIVLNEQTGMSADKPRKEIIASSASELDDIEVGHGSIAYAITDATLNVYDEENEEWTEVPTGGGGSSNKFIVTLTPTAQDYSGTMDKTVAEIYDAYEAGQDIWFDVVAPGMGHVELKCTQVGFDSSGFPSFNTYFIMDTNNMLVLMYTGTTDDGTKQTYFTNLYTLTPVS